jgi:hypothetical protein
MKSNIEIAEQAIRLMETVIKNELPTVSCPEKQSRVQWKRGEVRQIIISRLQGPSVVMIGPTILKNDS